MQIGDIVYDRHYGNGIVKVYTPGKRVNRHAHSKWKLANDDAVAVVWFWEATAYSGPIKLHGRMIDDLKIVSSSNGLEYNKVGQGG